MIAIFDNDTAAHAALRALNRVVLPSNVKVLTYPPLESAQSYPALGLNGIAEVDVNGLACSLELYFGKDILQRSDGTLTPVQWRGFDAALERYHGEIVDKAVLQSRFREKCAKAPLPGLDDGRDWRGMRAVLDAIHAAFIV